tara:strand:+ start:1901 stop:2071 length:171 start_codon:yes stop_codon:yes gene_type:complete
MLMTKKLSIILYKLKLDISFIVYDIKRYVSGKVSVKGQIHKKLTTIILSPITGIIR